MRVLIGCEFSGVVREAFRALGHDAWSCDLLPAEDGSKFHYQCDIFELICKGRKKWDLFIFHWPCTLLCNSGVRWLYGGKGMVISQPRFHAMKESARNFYGLLNCYIPKIAGENPIPHKFAREIMGDYTQLIQPYQFGHGETKATCLWLKNLPPPCSNRYSDWPDCARSSRTARAGSVEESKSHIRRNCQSHGRTMGTTLTNNHKTNL